ncbi:hypothetical protein OUZ56_006645 [Daphnia magna]|uniref:Uncharacterized protein n=1 Tax=Daphnia magna TaxID=35525 RepID=A0ABQ9YWE4_9CRUS|nr:hypothetical protein OUZ56_006645 [Daphnia magna]
MATGMGTIVKGIKWKYHGITRTFEDKILHRYLNQYVVTWLIVLCSVVSTFPWAGTNSSKGCRPWNADQLSAGWKCA